MDGRMDGVSFDLDFLVRWPILCVCVLVLLRESDCCVLAGTTRSP